MYTTVWYRKAESTPRYGVWYSGMGGGQVIGGIISFGAQHAPPNSSFGGWKIMFVVIGAINALAGLWAFLLLPESPETARFLTAQEKERVYERLREDQAGSGAKVLRWRAFIEVMCDLQTWVILLLTVISSIPGGGVITTFSATLIKNFGYNSKQSALLNMPTGVVSIIATMGSTYAIAKGFPRWMSINVVLLVTVLGACLMSFVPNSNQGGLLAGIYLVNAVCWISPRR